MNNDSESPYPPYAFDHVLSRLVKQDKPTPPLPNPDRVIALVKNLCDVMFPTTPTNSSQQRKQELQQLLHLISTQLTVDIQTALQQTAKAAQELHGGPQNSGSNPREHARRITTQFINALPQLQAKITFDIQAAFDGDPAARSLDEIRLCYPGLQAIMLYRFANQIHRIGVPYLPRILTEYAHRETGIDIHPGATIGPRFFIDHGTGVVIGETTIIGSNVTLYQGVTLGAWSFPRDEQGELIRGTKRHPTLEDNVVVYSNASILGGETIIGAGAQVGSGVTLSRSVPAGTIVTVEQPSLRFRGLRKTA